MNEATSRVLVVQWYRTMDEITQRQVRDQFPTLSLSGINIQYQGCYQAAMAQSANFSFFISKNSHSDEKLLCFE